MTQQIPLSTEALADSGEGPVHEVASDLAYVRVAIANVVLIGRQDAGDRGWVLVDAGVIGGKSRIQAAAAQRFGDDARPSAIILTHGHFDHVGGLEALANEWDAPIYAHSLEEPYLNGTLCYPQPNPAAGGGLISISSALFPTKPIDVSQRLRVLPSDGSIPPLPSWKFIHTPGHTPGHISLWRDRDRSLIVGDAFITTAQESVYAVLTQEIEMHGPPKYFTPNWPEAHLSVRRLAELDPELVITGHGHAMRGPLMRSALAELSNRFLDIAVP
jgi:glyoxylase-like metal-dependent hydrolase (beta-lactamase superfamily II)